MEIRIYCENIKAEVKVQIGTTLKDVSDKVCKEVSGGHPVLAALVDNKLEGKFTTENLKWAQQAGYTTVLWSSAYVDWNNNSQPSHDYAFEKIARRTFDGAVFLLHSTSKTNAEILDRQLTIWENAGYRFGHISELSGENAQ